MYWYEEEVKYVESKRVAPKANSKHVVFYGSSSIRLWPEIEKDFPSFSITNQAFGGSTLAACCWYFSRLIPQHKPDAMVIYAGDNDLGDGRHPEEVFYFFKSMMALMQEHCGNIPVAFISIKPSVSRMHLMDSIAYTNTIIHIEIIRTYPLCTFVDVYQAMLSNGLPNSAYFEDDGLHLSPLGYQCWKEILTNQFFNTLK